MLLGARSVLSKLLVGESRRLRGIAGFLWYTWRARRKGNRDVLGGTLLWMY
jgi:hypothetical protein